jgi:hypothetical protein
MPSTSGRPLHPRPVLFARDLGNWSHGTTRVSTRVLQVSTRPRHHLDVGPGLMLFAVSWMIATSSALGRQN